MRAVNSEVQLSEHICGRDAPSMVAMTYNGHPTQHHCSTIRQNDRRRLDVETVTTVARDGPNINSMSGRYCASSRPQTHHSLIANSTDRMEASWVSGKNTNKTTTALYQRHWESNLIW